MEPFEPFALTPEEAALSGVTYADGVLRVRSLSSLRFGAALQVAVGIVFAIFSASLGLSFATVIFVAVGLAVAASGIVALTGTTVCSPDGLSIRGLRTKVVPWPLVDHFDSATRSAWWTGRIWPPWDLVEVELRDGARVSLWPTRDVRKGRPGATKPVRPSVERALLQRYAEMYTKQ